MILDLESRAGAFGGVVGFIVCGDSAGCDVGSEDGAGEDLVGGFGLVGGDFVAGLEDAGEGEIAVLTDLAACVGGVGGDIGVACVLEFFTMAVWDI